jgi:hypothetical protein
MGEIAPDLGSIILLQVFLRVPEGALAAPA